MKKKMVAAVVALLFAACNSSSAPSGTQSTSALHSTASWPHHRNVGELVGESPLIVRAQVLEKLGERTLTGEPSQRFPIALTEFRIQIERTLKGAALGQVVVVMPGREGDPVNTYPELPLLKPGSQVLLFLRPSAEPRTPDGTSKFAIVSPEGLYQVIGRTLVTTSEETLIRSAAASGLDSFERAVLQAAQR